jgi:plastocyanin
MKMLCGGMVLAAALMICANLDGSPGRFAAGTDHPVTMKDNKFDPDPITITVGDSITWTNGGDNQHTSTSDEFTTKPRETWNTSTVNPRQKATINFNKAGTYKYHCDYHDGMTGTIIVK